MSIVTFWNDDKEQTGKTLTSVAVATMMAIERNFKILLISTSYKDSSMKNCFWTDTIQKSFFGKNNNMVVGNGIEGLSKLITSNKIQPSIITDYTHVIFKNRLEVLNGYMGVEDKTNEENLRDYQRTSECYAELINIANQYYDMVLVDLDNQLEPKVKNEILEISNLNVYVLTQRLSSLDRYNELKKIDKRINNPKCIPAIGKFNKESKYNKKNILRYLEHKKDINLIPFNTLFFEAAEEKNVTELFLKLRNIKDTTDGNYFFMQEVKKLSNDIINRIQELQVKMR